METQIKGDKAVAAIIYKLTKAGYTISLPITESAEYDLVIEKEGKIERVQVKYSKREDIDLRKIHSNSKGYVIKKYSKNAFDVLAVVKPTEECYLIRRSIEGRSYIRPKKEELVG